MYRRIIYQNEDETDDEQIIDIKRRPRVFYEKVNYSELYDDHDFINRFRISKSTFSMILRVAEKEISPPSYRNGAILAPCKLYMMLRYLATGSFLLTISDFVGTSESSAYRYIHQTCIAIAKLRPKFMSFSTNDVDIRKVITGIYGRCRFPRIIRAIDCTHIKIQSPGGDNGETFKNRKGYFSINVQCVCNPWLKITDIVARWPGSCQNYF